jgi:circadian clock protein KaiB
MSQAYVLRLYITGDAPNSVRARSNLAAITNERLAGREHTIEEIDVLKDPRRALADNILVTPTLVRLKPDPERRIVGNLSEREKVVAALGL